MLKKFLVSAAAVLGFSSVADVRAQEACVPISAQQIYARQYSDQVAQCNVAFNYRAADHCRVRAANAYSARLSSHPDPFTPVYCDPLYVRPPFSAYAPPSVYVQPRVIDPSAVLGAIIVGKLVYDFNRHHRGYDHGYGRDYRRFDPPQRDHGRHDRSRRDRHRDRRHGHGR